jgi:hypothetical protein
MRPSRRSGVVETEPRLLKGWFPFDDAGGATRWRWVTGVLTKPGTQHNIAWSDGDEWELSADVLDFPPQGRKYGIVVHLKQATPVMLLQPADYRALRGKEEQREVVPGEKRGTPRTQEIKDRKGPLRRLLVAGDKVTARYPQLGNSQGKWYPAKVDSVDAVNGTVYLNWDDGDRTNRAVRIDAVRVGWDFKDFRGEVHEGPSAFCASCQPCQSKGGVPRRCREDLQHEGPTSPLPSPR